MTEPTNTPAPDNGPLAYFKAQAAAFAHTLDARRGREDLLDALLGQAWDCFEGNVAIQAEGAPPLACHKGCASCCTVRVSATAPEVIYAARYVRVAAAPLARAGVHLEARIREADAVTRSLDQAARVKLRARCPFIQRGVCVIYPVRPLACRGHASHDKRACVDAAAGRAESVPYSMAHMTVRSLLQNAMQFALRDAGYAWGAYEFNHALVIALDSPDCEVRWAAGEDVFAAARTEEVAPEEMVRTFEAIRAQH